MRISGFKPSYIDSDDDDTNSKISDQLDGIDPKFYPEIFQKVIGVIMDDDSDDDEMKEEDYFYILDNMVPKDAETPDDYVDDLNLPTYELLTGLLDKYNKSKGTPNELESWKAFEKQILKRRKLLDAKKSIESLMATKAKPAEPDIIYYDSEPVKIATNFRQGNNIKTTTQGENTMSKNQNKLNNEEAELLAEGMVEGLKYALADIFSIDVEKEFLGDKEDPKNRHDMVDKTFTIDDKDLEKVKELSSEEIARLVKECRESRDEKVKANKRIEFTKQLRKKEVILRECQRELPKWNKRLEDGKHKFKFLLMQEDLDKVSEEKTWEIVDIMLPPSDSAFVKAIDKMFEEEKNKTGVLTPRQLWKLLNDSSNEQDPEKLEENFSKFFSGIIKRREFLKNHKPSLKEKIKDKFRKIKEWLQENKSGIETCVYIIIGFAIPIAFGIFIGKKIYDNKTIKLPETKDLGLNNSFNNEVSSVHRNAVQKPFNSITL